MKIRGVKISLFILIVILLFIGFFIFGDDKKPNEIKEILKKEIPSEPECVNTSLLDVAECLNDYVNDIFIYNLTKDGDYLTLDELKLRGGDCLDYTRFYEKYLSKYGYYSKRIEFYIGAFNMNHVLLLTSDNKGYCFLDLKEITCFKYLQEGR